MKKQTCESSMRLSVGDLKKWGYLSPEQARSGVVTWTRGLNGNKSGVSIYVSTFEPNPYMQVTYTASNRWTGEMEDIDYKVWFAKTPCNFGGHRYWFVCPLHEDGITCGKRVGFLYLVDQCFGCRRCHDLAYKSQQCYFGGKNNPMFRWIILDDEVERELASIRVKFWKGKPTKRYRKLLRKMDQFRDLSLSILS